MQERILTCVFWTVDGQGDQSKVFIEYKRKLPIVPCARALLTGQVICSTAM